MGRVGEKEPAEERLSGCVADEMAKLCSRASSWIERAGKVVGTTDDEREQLRLVLGQGWCLVVGDKPGTGSGSQ